MQKWNELDRGRDSEGVLGHRKGTSTRLRVLQMPRGQEQLGEAPAEGRQGEVKGMKVFRSLGRDVSPFSLAFLRNLTKSRHREDSLFWGSFETTQKGGVLRTSVVSHGKQARRGQLDQPQRPASSWGGLGAAHCRHTGVPICTCSGPHCLAWSSEPSSLALAAVESTFSLS